MRAATTLLLATLVPAIARSPSAQAPVPPATPAEWGPGLATRTEFLNPRGSNSIFIPVDIDGDGDMDALQFGSWNRSGLLTVTINEGGGRFATRILPPTQTQAWLSVYYLGVGDIDGDGDPDVVAPGFRLDSNFGTDAPWVHLNDGRGNFVMDATRFAPKPRIRGNCVLADVDRDGDLDAIFSGGPAGTIPGSVEVWLNDGRGFFTDVTATHLPTNTFAGFVAAADLDGDGAVDLVIANWSATSDPKRILWNDGTGHFTIQSIPPVNSVEEIYIFDADGDGDLDILFSGGWKHLFRNDGQRVFVQLPFPNDNPAFAYGPTSVGDIDADGDLDVVIREFVLLNDGRGNFTETPGWIHGVWTQGLDRMAFADLDGDGDQDAFVRPSPPISAFNGAVFYNRHRQVWGPTTVARGTTYMVEVTGRPWTTFALAAHGAVMVTPWSLGPLGTWWLDPGSMVVLPPVRCGSLGTATLPIPIPNVPSLAGKTLFLQGMDLGDTVPRLVHATGYWAVRVQ